MQRCLTNMPQKIVHCLSRFQIQNLRQCVEEKHLSLIELNCDFRISTKLIKETNIYRYKKNKFANSRDVRVFVIFLVALLNLPLVTLGVVALTMKVKVIRRIMICRRSSAT